MNSFIKPAFTHEIKQNVTWDEALKLPNGLKLITDIHITGANTRIKVLTQYGVFLRDYNKHLKKNRL